MSAPGRETMVARPEGRGEHNRMREPGRATQTPLFFLRESMEKQQTFASHAKYDPPFHFFVLPLLAINVIVIAYELFRFPGVLGTWLLVMALVLLVMAGRMRSYATHLQDRIIRVEERLR